MLTLSTNRRRKKSKTLVYLATIVVVSVLLIMLLGKATSKEDQNENINKVPELTQNESQTNTQTVAKIEDETETEKAVEPQPTEPVKEEPSQESTVDFEGTEVPASGFKIKVPKQFFYSFSNEGGVQLLNLGTKDFGPENPYNFSMSAEASGYISPIEQIPSESIGGLVESIEEKTNSGLTLQKKVYRGVIDGSNDVTQLLYTFEIDAKKYGAIFWTASSNETHLSRFSDMLKTVSP